MNLKQYVQGLVDFLEENPELSSAAVGYFTDDEGNSAHQVFSGAQVYYTENMREYYLEVTDEDDNGLPIVMIN